jgi:uncharacterized protein (TIGR03545 family)
MRKKGLIFLIIVAALVIALNVFVTDRWIERRVERLASKSNGAKVELYRFDFSLFDLSLSWEGLQVTDPDDTWTNLFETGRCSFDLALEPLMQRKVVVEEFELQGLRMGTARETDGALTGKSKKKTIGQSKIVQSIEQNVRTEIESYPLLNLGLLKGTVDLDALWDEAALQSPGKIEALGEQYGVRYDEWRRRVGELPGKVEAEALERDLEAIQIQQIETPQQAKEAYDKLQLIEQKNSDYLGSVRRMRDELESEAMGIADLKDEIDSWVDEDYRRILAMAGLPEFSRETVSAMIFGRPVAEKMEKALRILGRVRNYSQKVGKYIPAKEFPPRGVGQDIRFTRKQDYPAFWIQRLILSGETAQGIGIEGSVLHLVSDQRKIDRPTTMQLAGSRADGAGLDFAAVVDSRDDEPREQFNLSLKGIPLAGRSITDFPFLAYPLSAGVGTVTGKIDFAGSRFLAEIGFSGRDVDFNTQGKPEALDDDLYELSLAMVRKIDEIDLVARVRQSGDDFKLDMKSNLDDIVLGVLKQVVSDEVQAVQNELMERIEDEIGADRDEVESLVEEGEGSLREAVEDAEGLFMSQQDRIEQKRAAIDERVKAEELRARKQAEEELQKKQDAVKDKGKEALDSLF